jgi:hypothetical protein
VTFADSYKAPPIEFLGHVRPPTPDEIQLARLAIEHRADTDEWNDDEVGRVLTMLGLADDIDIT